MTPMRDAGIQASPSPYFNRTAIIAEENTAPGPARRATGLNVLRRRRMSVLIAASKMRIGRNRFKTRAGSKPMRRDNSSVIGKPANTKPVT